jgi:acetyltransferase EpsM
MSAGRPGGARPLGLLIGAGGHGRVVAAVWQRAQPEWDFAFLDDNSRLWGTRVAGLLVRGGLDSPGQLGCSGARAHIALGDNATRLRLAGRLQGQISFANVIDPSAVIMPGTELGTGILVGPQAVVQTAAQIGDHVIINTGAIVEHDCILEAGATVAPGVRMAGRVHIERQAFVAAGVTLVGRVRVGAGAIIGAGAVVTSDIPAECLAYGVPSRVVRPAAARDWARLL